MKTATVVQHVPFEGLGSFEAVLKGRGFQIRTLHAASDDVGAHGMGTPDLVIVLGGPLSVNDEADFPFLVDELRFLGEWLRADRPCLGVCLGAQLMSKALGGTVRSMGHKEVGWGPLELVPEETSVLSVLGDRSTTLHWHGEAFSIPEGARRLARSPLCETQAFSWRRAGLGLQFHPEVTAAGLEAWYVGHVLELNTARIDIPKLRRESYERDAAQRTAAERMLTLWLDDLGL